MSEKVKTNEIKFCRYCGAGLNGDVFCAKCGKITEKIQTEQKNEITNILPGNKYTDKVKSSRLISIFCIFVVALLLALPFLTSLLLSFKEYTPRLGLFFSPGVGLSQYESYFTNAYSGRIIMNTLFLNISGIIVCAAYVLCGELAIGSAKNKWLKALLALLFCLPAVIPSNMLHKIMPVEFLTTPSQMLVFAVSVLQNLRLAALVTAGAFLIGNIHEKHVPKCALLYLAIRLIWLFTADVVIILSTYNPKVYEILDTMSTHVYRSGFQQQKWSYSAVPEVLRVVFQLIPAVAGCFILTKSVFKNKSAAFSNNAEGDSSLAVGIGSLAAGLILSMAAVFEIENIAVAAIFNGFVYSVASALAVSGLAMLLYLLCRRCGFAGLIALVIMLVLSGGKIGYYLLLHDIIPCFAVTLHSLSIAPLVTLIFMYAVEKEKRINCYHAFPGIAGLMFAWFWGDHFSPMLFCADRAKSPVSLIAREVVNNADVGQNPLAASIIAAYIIVPIIAAYIGLIVSALISQRKKQLG